MSSPRPGLRLRVRRLGPVLGLLALAGLAAYLGIAGDGSRAPRGGEEAIRAAFEARRSGWTVEAAGTVTRVLEDDRRPPRHQRFIVTLPGGHTVLVSHNLELAPRVPVRPGDEVGFRGEYEWNPKGGVVHWTHADPARRRPGGWIRHRGIEYR